ncbi:hypothetical protein FS749_003445 [Ceratobasidium sp. UAMH 11750]|nr:hypothetical protein FS749_003445 [Ceratobasidium sp. UAMH 11750]
MQPFLPHPSAQLPIVSTKRDAQANQSEGGGNKLSVADSLILLQSLKQSRSIWLTKAFLRFSTRSKNRADQVHPAPPPHSLSLAGSCDLEIGPHLFPQTNIYFVQYQYTHTHTPAPVPTPKPVQAPAPTPAPAATQPAAAPITVSHELHAKVLAAAAKDPELQTILQLAAQGRANVAQLRVLGTTIKAIEAGTYPNVSTTGTQPPAAPAPTASTSRPPAPAPAAVAPAIPRPAPAPIPTTPAIPTTAILIEFAERPVDRWLLPSEYVLLDKTSNGDVLLSTFYPFDAYVPSGSVGPNGVAVRSKPANPLTMRFVAAPTGVWTALSRTCTTVSPASAQGVLAEVITNVPTRTYLQYRIAPGSLWEELKAKNPSAKSVLLPPTTPKPLASTAQGRRAEDSAGGGATKRRRTNAGDSGTSTPAETGAKSKGKGKEKEKGATPSGTKRLAPTQPAATAIASTSSAPPAGTPGQQSHSANLNSATPNAQIPTTLAPIPSNPPPNAPASILPGTTFSAPLPLNTTAAVAGPSTHSAPATKTPNIPPSVTTPGTSAIPTPGPAQTVPATPTNVASSVPQPQGGTLSQALPPQPTPAASRAPVQHISASLPGEGVKILGSEPTPGS